MSLAQIWAFCVALVILLWLLLHAVWQIRDAIRQASSVRNRDMRELVDHCAYIRNYLENLSGESMERKRDERQVNELKEHFERTSKSTLPPR